MQLLIWIRNLFSGVAKTRIIKLRYNQISIIDDFVFSKCTQLNDFYVSNNKLEIITDQTFSGIVHVECELFELDQ
jgi:hypothetical protein